MSYPQPCTTMEIRVWAHHWFMRNRAHEQVPFWAVAMLIAFQRYLMPHRVKRG